MRNFIQKTTRALDHGSVFFIVASLYVAGGALGIGI